MPGANHLAWEVEVGNGADVREFVYVDAHTGKVVDQHHRHAGRACSAAPTTAEPHRRPPPNYPGCPFWVEGQTVPDRHRPKPTT